MVKNVVFISIAVVLAAAGCQGGTTSFGTPQGGPVQPGPIGNPNGATANPALAGAKAVSDAQSVDDVAKWYLTKMSAAPPDDKLKKRIEARAKFDAQKRMGADAAPAAQPLTLEVKNPPAKDAPDGAIYALTVPSFPSEEAGAVQLAAGSQVTREHQVVDPKDPAQAPAADIIKISKGAIAWTMDRLTGLITFEKTHNDGMLATDVKSAQAAAETFVRDHGGLPEDALAGEPISETVKGDGNAAPKLKKITFVWRHKDKAVFGNDGIFVDVTADSATGGTVANQAAAGWGVTHLARLWRTRGKEIAKEHSLITADGALEKVKASAIAGIDPAKPVTVSDVTFGEYRADGAIAQAQTRPVWDIVLAGKHVDVDAKSGEVFVPDLAPPAPEPAADAKKNGKVKRSTVPAAASASAPAGESTAAPPGASSSPGGSEAPPAASATPAKL